ncbi:MAG: phosphate ABC transporter permease subunit PstC [Desulfobacteraceae bacterium]|nr:MAG: phosphate ABC transporter permease subunit PstC [Desulfobacteraceae bacterium]
MFNTTLTLAALTILILVLALALSLLSGSLPALKSLGLGFFYSAQWDPVAEHFGVLPFLLGTLITSFLALLLSLPLSLAIALLLGEYMRRGFLAGAFKSMVDLIAAVPSVIYGFWGLMFLVPIVRIFEMKIGVAPYGIGIFSSALLLAVMIIPNTASIAREVIEMVPADIQEAAYSLGATRYDVIRRVIIPFARSGILAGVLLSLGRALGETMAVTMVIGNANVIPTSIFQPANTMASVIANELAEAHLGLHYSSLVLVGLTLFVLTALLNYLGTRIIKRFTV